MIHDRTWKQSLHYIDASVDFVMILQNYESKTTVETLPIKFLQQIRLIQNLCNQEQDEI